MLKEARMVQNKEVFMEIEGLEWMEMVDRKPCVVDSVMYINEGVKQE